MEKRILLLALLITGITNGVHAFARIQQYGNQAAAPSASSLYADKLSTSRGGQMASGQLQNIEGQASSRFQSTSAGQRVQSINSSVQNPGANVSSRMGGMFSR